MNNRLLITEELAAYLRCSPRNVHRLVAQGKIPRLRVGRLVRYDLEDVMAELKRQAFEGGTELIGGRRADIHHRRPDVLMVENPLHFMDSRPSLDQVCAEGGF